jgi:hypothetical protein
MMRILILKSRQFRDQPGYHLDGELGKRRWRRAWRFGQRPGLFGLGPVQIIDLTDEIHGTAKEVLQWALGSLRGAYRNNDTGWAILVARKGLEKVLSHSRRTDVLHLRAIRSLPSLLVRAVLAESYPDRRGDLGIVAVHRRYAAARVYGQVYRVKITVKERADGRRFYDQSLTEIERPARGGAAREPGATRLGHAPSISGAAGTTHSPGLQISISDLLRGAIRDGDGRPFAAPRAAKATLVLSPTP